MFTNLAYITSVVYCFWYLIQCLFLRPIMIIFLITFLCQLTIFLDYAILAPRPPPPPTLSFQCMHVVLTRLHVS